MANGNDLDYLVGSGEREETSFQEERVPEPVADIQRRNGNGRPKYRQPHNITPPEGLNPAQAAKFVEREHGRQKYDAKYRKSKQPRRLPD